jgi:hypothetical protein
MARARGSWKEVDMVAPTPSGYSAAVKLELQVGEERIPLAQVGGGRLVFYQETVLPGTGGIVVAYIDEHVDRCEARWAASGEARKVVAVEMRELVEGSDEASVVQQVVGDGA